MTWTRFGFGPLPASRPGVGRNLRAAVDFAGLAAFCAVFGGSCAIFFFDLLILFEEYSTVIGGALRERNSKRGIRREKHRAARVDCFPERKSEINRPQSWTASLYGEEEVLGERPFGIKPLAVAAIAGPLTHLNDFSGIVFVRAFGPDGFAFTHIETETRFANGDALPGFRLQMHFHAPLGLVVTRHMLEKRQIEIGVEVAVDAREEVHIERGGHAGWVVIGGQQLRYRLFQVGGEQQRIARLQDGANFA